MAAADAELDEINYDPWEPNTGRDPSSVLETLSTLPFLERYVYALTEGSFEVQFA